LAFDPCFGEIPEVGRPCQDIFGKAAGCLGDSEFLPVWKKRSNTVNTMIKAYGLIGIVTFRTGLIENRRSDRYDLLLDKPLSNLHMLSLQ
jgi:hypothetical protein